MGPFPFKTLYPTTFHLLAQGSSYLLWVDEHMPVICAHAEHMFMDNASSWVALARRRGIGLKCESCTMRSLRPSRSSDLASADNVVYTKKLTSLPLGVANITSTPITPNNELSADLVHLSSSAEVQASSLPTHDNTDGSVSDSIEQPPNTKSNHKTPKASKNIKPNKNKFTTKKSAVKKEKFVWSDLSHTRCNSKCPIPASASMIRCSLCMTRYRVESTGEDTKYVSVWSCRSCRISHSFIHDLSTQMDRLLECVQSRQTREVALQAEVQQLKAENSKLGSKLNHTESHNNELTKLIETMIFPSTIVASESVSSPQHKRPSQDPFPSNQLHTSNTLEQPWITVPTANHLGVLNDLGVKPHSQCHSPGRRSHHGTVSSSACPAPHKDLTVTVICNQLFVEWHHLFTGNALMQVDMSFLAAPRARSTLASGIFPIVTSQSWERGRTISSNSLLNSARKKSIKS